MTLASTPEGRAEVIFVACCEIMGRSRTFRPSWAAGDDFQQFRGWSGGAVGLF